MAPSSSQRPSGPSSEQPSGPAIRGRNPFLPPEEARQPARRLRGRLPAPVTLWTASLPGAGGGAPARAGLPVSSLLVADGDPAYVAGLVDADSDLWEVLERRGRFVVQVLGWSQRGLADAFGELGPAPGGPFRLAEWEDTAWGPLLRGAGTWAGCVVSDIRRLGWGQLVQGELEHVQVGEDDGVLVHYRGRYRTLS